MLNYCNLFYKRKNMIAIPVKTDKETSAVAPLFGKAKWFAIIGSDGAISFWHNELKSGREVVNHFQAIGVTRVVFQDMGGCYHSGEGRVLLADAVARLQKDELVEVTQQNMAEYVERSQRHSKGEHHEGHEHHDHGHHH
jgi:predicted Fe-Mo cluster-binding NifX family protein